MEKRFYLTARRSITGVNRVIGEFRIVRVSLDLLVLLGLLRLLKTICRCVLRTVSFARIDVEGLVGA